jgi:hypothetical protein
MCLKIRCDGESEKVCKIFWEGLMLVGNWLLEVHATVGPETGRPWQVRPPRSDELLAAIPPKIGRSDRNRSWAGPKPIATTVRPSQKGPSSQRAGLVTEAVVPASLESCSWRTLPSFPKKKARSASRTCPVFLLQFFNLALV